MAESPVLATERLQIVPFSEIYLTPRYVGWLNDLETMRYSEQRHRSHSMESCRAYWQSFAGTPHYFWAVVARDARLGHIGNMNAYVDPVHNVADVGILIGERSAWGCGYGTEAWIAICDYLLGAAGIRKVTAGTLSANFGMLKLMQRAGMVEDGRRVRQCLFEGCEVDIVHKALFREDWERSKQAIGSDNSIAEATEPLRIALAARTR